MFLSSKGELKYSMLGGDGLRTMCYQKYISMIDKSKERPRITFRSIELMTIGGEVDRTNGLQRNQ